VAGDEVKSTRYPNGHLMIDLDADPALRHVLLVGESDHWRVAGWLIAREGKRECYRRHPNDGREPAVRAPAYLVPQADLHHDLTALRATQGRA
jgi:hypothetical protein